MSNVTKSPKQQKAQITKCPKLQNIQSCKIIKDTKCPKLQNNQRYTMSKVKKGPIGDKVKYPKFSKNFKIIKCLIIYQYY